VTGIAPDLVLTDSPHRFHGKGQVLQVDPSWMEGDGRPTRQTWNPGTGGSDLCCIALTSGSTGVAKGVAFTHDLLQRRLAELGARFAHCSRLFCDLGIATSPGFHYMLATLSRGGTAYFVGSDPEAILQAFDLYKIEGMATSPFGLAEFLKYFETDSAFEVSFNLIICQGAMLSRELSMRARARLCPNLYSSYGATETARVAFGPASALDAVPGAVGYIQPGVAVEVIDSSGNVLPHGRDGTLRIRSRLMASGYFGDPETTQTYFRDGCFYSGDIGHTTPEGILVITGREKTALNVGGDTISPELVEAVIGSFPGVKEAGVFATSNELGIAEIVALIVASQPVDDAALREFCAARLPSYGVPVRFTSIDALPRGGQGKIERRRLPDLAAARMKPA